VPRSVSKGGSIFEGGVDQQGLVSGRAPSVLDVTVTALVPGERPVVRKMKINVLPGPAARIVLEPRPTRLVVGQKIKLRPSVYSKANEPRAKDVVTGDVIHFTVDISGELRGDVGAQQREIAHVDPTFPTGKVPNAAFTRGAVVRDGLAYINDMNNGLMIMRSTRNRPPCRDAHPSRGA